MNICKLILFFVFCLALTACASESLKAPCDELGHFCGTKTSINTTRG